MNIKLTSIIATILIATATASHAFEPTWLPGGEDVKKAVAARQDGTVQAGALNETRHMGDRKSVV